jgi:hypothetical protein
MSLLSECDFHGWFDELSRQEKIELIEALLPDEKDECEKAYWTMLLKDFLLH